MTSLDPIPPDGKPAVRSVTIWAAASAFAALLVQIVLPHLHVADADVRQAAQDVAQIITAAGSLVAIWGRTRASRPITTLIKKED